MFVAFSATNQLKLLRPKIFYYCFQNNILLILICSRNKNITKGCHTCWLARHVLFSNKLTLNVHCLQESYVFSICNMFAEVKWIRKHIKHYNILINLLYKIIIFPTYPPNPYWHGRLSGNKQYFILAIYCAYIISSTQHLPPWKHFADHNEAKQKHTQKYWIAQ